VPAYSWLRRGQHTRPFRHIVMPLCGFAIVGFIFTGFDRMTFLFGCAWLVAGLLVGVLRHQTSLPLGTSP